MSANTYGRQVVLPLTNKSGGSVAAGDVVIVDTTNNDAFTTTTSASFGGVIGIAQETIANNAVGRVLMAGYAALVNVPASVTRGHYLFTHTVVKQATGSASRAVGAFGQFLTGGATPDAHLFGITDPSVTGLSDPMTTRGDVIVRNASNVTARLAIGSSGKVLQSDGTDVSWQTPAAGASPLLAVLRYRPGSDSTILSSASTTLTDVDATNCAITFTAPASTNVIVDCRCNIQSPTNNYARLGLREATTNIAAASNVVFTPGTTILAVGTSFLLSGISAGSHTYKLAFSVAGGTGIIYGGPTYGQVEMTVWAAP
jgi:hypothetical protein